MKQYIIFTTLGRGPNVYPNMVEARSLDAAIELVINLRTGHQVVAFSNKSGSTSAAAMESYTAITKAIPPKNTWRTGTYMGLK